jgi:Family of unknown function (DUF6526)
MLPSTMQNYENHRYNPKLTRVGFAFLCVSIVAFALRIFGIGGERATMVGVSGLIATSLVLLLISRLYITALQNRIIKLEMAMRAAALLSPEQQRSYAALSRPQIVALRFASDEELAPLADRAARESMSPDQIKKAIRTWRPDLDRT